MDDSQGVIVFNLSNKSHSFQLHSHEYSTFYFAQSRFCLDFLAAAVGQKMNVTEVTRQLLWMQTAPCFTWISSERTDNMLARIRSFSRISVLVRRFHH